LLLSLVADITETNALVIPIMYAALMYQHIDNGDCVRVHRYTMRKESGCGERRRSAQAPPRHRTGRQ
jgi:hypothetical protein